MEGGHTSLFALARERVAVALDATAAPDDGQQPVVPVALVAGADDLQRACGGDAAALQWAANCGYQAKKGEVLVVPDAAGGVRRCLLGVPPRGGGGGGADPWAYAALPSKLPPGRVYALEEGEGPEDGGAAVLGWALGSYKFDVYKSPSAANNNSSSSSSSSGDSAPPRLVLPKTASGGSSGSVSEARAMAEAFFWARLMITTPAEDLGPQHMAREAAALAAAHPNCSLRVIEGDALLREGFPAIHTVGRAAARPPLLLDLRWAPPAASSTQLPQPPNVVLVGKGVCFDSGGLDLKTPAGMRLMKKDMGGGALVLALAHVAMSAAAPLRLRVLVPCVENAVAGNAYRPGDVLRTRAGITVENGNTDAEGRLILCDALYEAIAGAAAGKTEATAPAAAAAAAAACKARDGAPDLVIDAATLTGAARVALGPELPAVFCSCDDAWRQLEAAAREEGDPLWRLPLHAGYRRMLDSKVADISSTGSEAGQAGAIAAALFLNEFVRAGAAAAGLPAGAAPAWCHIDTAGWQFSGGSGPGRPEGGEALALRALWRFLRERYAPK